MIARRGLTAVDKCSGRPSFSCRGDSDRFDLSYCFGTQHAWAAVVSADCCEAETSEKFVLIYYNTDERAGYMRVKVAANERTELSLRTVSAPQQVSGVREIRQGDDGKVFRSHRRHHDVCCDEPRCNLVGFPIGGEGTPGGRGL